MKIAKQLLLVFLLLFMYSLWINGQTPDTLKILAIGNSFSEDATEEYLDDLARAAGIKLIIGNACISGCELKRHSENAQTDSAHYGYRKIDLEGVRTVTGRRTLYECITDENWDYITLQQHSGLTGKLDSYFPYLSYLIEYVRTHATNPDMQLAFHQTWAYAKDSKHARFVNYNNNQEEMYRAIVETVNKATRAVGIQLIIPAGTAIQNVRYNMKRDDLCRDGYHLDKGIGRYIASCAWFETLLGEVVGNPFYPETLTAEDALSIQKAARAAAREPNRVSTY